MFKKYLLALLLGLFITASAQDFIPENVLVYLQYSNNMRDKFLPVWQNTIKKNTILKETYISYDNSSLTDQIPIPFDSTIFNYDTEGKLISAISTSPFPGAENSVRLTTTFHYDAGLLVGSKDDRGNQLFIKRDEKGRISTLEYGEYEDKILYKYKYSDDKLMTIDILYGENQMIRIVQEDGIFVAKDTSSLMSTVGDKYGRVTNVYSHNFGMDNLYDTGERLIESKIYQGGTTEITMFIYSGDLLQEIGYNNHEGEIGAELKDTKITKSVRTVVKYDK